MTYPISLILLYCALCASCAISLKNKATIPSEYSNRMITTAIADFSKGGKMFRDDSVFQVDFYKTYTRVEVEEDEFGLAREVVKKRDNNIFVVGITANYNKFIVKDTTGTTVEARGIPTHYLESEGKLFLWTDFSYPPRSNIHNVLQDHNLLLPNNLDGLIAFTEATEVISSKSTHYFFCANNFNKYKKSVTDVPLGYYDLPRGLKCN